MEIWKDIPNTDGFYQASTLSRIRSTNRVVDGSKTSVRNIKGKILSQYVGTCGYLRVGIREHNCSSKVNVLVAKTFIPNPDNKEQVNHIDGNKLNNDLSNLEWCTSSENIQHSIKIGTFRKCKAVNEIDIHDNIIGKYKSQSEASRSTGVSRAIISNICRGINTSCNRIFKFNLAEGLIHKLRKELVLK